MKKRLLIANRSEIACRIIRTAKEMGYTTIVASSEADASWLPARLADEYVILEGNTPKETYLHIPKIIAAAKKMKADLVHPGYGFLSENPALSKACKEAKISFVGPSEKVLATLGSKIIALKMAQKADVPTIPGLHEKVTLPEVKAFAQQHGYPILIKASDGGGGRGMRKVSSEKELEEAYASAQRESLAAFGSSALFVERYLEDAKHIEIQTARDTKGNCITVGERDCSLQRRNQKLIEEAPGPFPKLRTRLETYAKKLFDAVGYVGIGTVEFLIDKKGEPHFIEVNARIQVEHPVTECISSMDFVRLQLDIVTGKTLPKKPVLKGHAIEARILAENPYAGGIPQTGIITGLHIPQGVRWESALEKGTVITSYYDSLIGKLICYGKDRKEALSKMQTALNELQIKGIITNIAYLKEMMQTQQFKKTTHTIQFHSSYVPPPATKEEQALAAAAIMLPITHPPIARGWPK